MAKTVALLLVCLVLLSSCTGTPPQVTKVDLTKDLVIEIDSSRLWGTLEKLNYPRRFGTEGEDQALTYLKGALENYGYTTAIEEFTVYKQDIASLSVNYHQDYFIANPYNSQPLGVGRNIIARQVNYDDGKNTIYVTAHYDTIPKSTGILDNASGVSVVVEVARQLRDYHGPFNIVFVLFSAEEYGITGSRAFIAKLTDADKMNAIGAINIDMVGEKEAGDIVMRSSSRGHNVLSLMMNNHATSPLPILVGGNSDELSFYMGRIPAITLADQSPDRMRAMDDNQLQYIDLDQLSDVANLVAGFLAELSTSHHATVLNTMSSPSTMGIHGSPWADLIDGSELVGLDRYLTTNGHDSETIYVYETPNGERCTVTESSRLFVDPGVYSDWASISGRFDTHYCIPKEAENGVSAYYVMGLTFGAIKGDVSSDEAFDMINRICRIKYGT